MGPIRQVMVRGLERVDQLFVLTMAAYSLARQLHWNTAMAIFENQAAALERGLINPDR